MLFRVVLQRILRELRSLMVSSTPSSTPTSSLHAVAPTVCEQSHGDQWSINHERDGAASLLDDRQDADVEDTSKSTCTRKRALAAMVLCVALVGVVVVWQTGLLNRTFSHLL
jgi:hypothetical protein